ncbi:MAG: hypothetical protein V4695_09470 [Pseudomonadota bacterium]
MGHKFTGNIVVLWMAALISAGALAGPGTDGERSGSRDERRDYRQGARSDIRESQQYLPPLQAAPSTQFQQAQPAAQPPGYTGSSDAGRRHGKMSPEERRALRQQIDQARHELTPPSR